MLQYGVSRMLTLKVALFNRFAASFSVSIPCGSIKRFEKTEYMSVEKMFQFPVVQLKG